MDRIDYKGLIHNWRISLGLTQEGMAEFFDVSPQTIYSLEKGRNSPSKNTINIICRKLGITIDEFHRGPELGANNSSRNGDITFSLPEDLMNRLSQVSSELEFGKDFILRAVLEVFFSLDAGKQLAELRDYYDLIGVRFEELKKNPHPCSNPNKK